jgi:hypothetical protein
MDALLALKILVALAVAMAILLTVIVLAYARLAVYTRGLQVRHLQTLKDYEKALTEPHGELASRPYYVKDGHLDGVGLMQAIAKGEVVVDDITDEN